MVNNLLDKFKYNSRFGGLVKYEASGFWDDNELQIAGTYENGTVGAANAPMSFDLAKKNLWRNHKAVSSRKLVN